MILDVNNWAELQLVAKGAGDQIIGLTSGCFDLFHHLHHIFLQRCRRKCDLLVVGVNSDDLVRQEKGEERPIIPEHQRVEMVNAQRAVAVSFVMDSIADLRTMAGALVAPNKYLQVFKNQVFAGRDDVAGTENKWSRLVIIPDVEAPNSTSAIIEQITEMRGQKGTEHEGTG